MIEDVQTEQRLKTSLELEAENQELEAENQELKAEKNAAQQRAAEMATLLARYQKQFGDLPKGNSTEV